MIYEYAIDPDFIIDLSENIALCDTLNNTLEVSNHSILSNYPNQLAKQIYNEIKKKIASSQNETKAKWQNKGKMLEPLLETINNKPKAKRFNSHNNFPDEHNRYLFQGVFSTKYTFNGNITSSWLRDKQCLFGKHPNSVTAKRNSIDQSSALTPLLSNASEFIFVDPYFFGEPRYLDVYKEYFSSIEKTRFVRSSNAQCKIYIIAAHFPHKKNSVPYSEFVNSCQQFNSIKPSNITLEIRRIQEISGKQEIHDRYLLTDIGGVSLGHGTDISNEVNTSSEVNIMLLERDVWKKWRKAYTHSSPHFDWSEAPIIL